MVTVVKPTAKPRRARLLSKGRKLNNKKRGRPKKAAPAAEKKNKKNQSALDLLHAKTLSAAPPQGQRIRNKTVLPFLNEPIDLKQPLITERNNILLHHYCLSGLEIDVNMLLCVQMHTGHLRVPSTSYLPRSSTIPLVNCC